MFKTSLLAATVAAAFLTGSAIAANIGGVQFPINPPPQVFGEQSREQTCRQYNQQVSIIRSSFENSELTTSVDFLNSLCSYIRLSDGQLEETLYDFQTIIYNRTDSHVGNLFERVDLTRKFELLILSQPNETKYVYYDDTDLRLGGQSYFPRGGTWPDDYVVRTPEQFTATYNPYGVGLTYGVFHRVNSQSSITNGSPHCQNNYSGAGCLPGGAANSRYIELESDFIPQTTNQNTNLTVSESTSFGFDIGAEAKSNKEVGVSVGFGASFSSTVSRERSVMTVRTTRASDDRGISSSYELSPSAVAALYGFGYSTSTSSPSISDERIGSSAWRDLAVPTAMRWREYVNSNNCSPGTTRSVGFNNKLTIPRGAYDLDGSGSTAVWHYEDSTFQTATVTRHSSFTVNTECKVDTDGNRYRVHKSGILN